MKQWKKHLWLISLVVLAVGCSALGGEQPPPRVTPRPTPALTPVYSTLPLTPQNSTRAVELATISTGKASGPIAALAFSADGRELLAVHGMEGLLRRWRVEDGVLLNTLDVSPVGMAAVAFDAQARLVAIGAGYIKPAVRAGYAAEVEEARVWDTRSGKLIVDTGGVAKSYVTDLALSPDGQWLAKIYPTGIDIVETSTGIEVFGKPREFYESLVEPSITAATFGPAGDWLAYADNLGYVEMWEPKSLEPFSWDLEHGDTKREKAIPLALALDSSRHRLAAVTTEKLIVWELQNSWPNDKVVLKKSLPASPLAGLAFSPDGTLLAVGTASGWQLWSVGDKKLLLKDERETFAVTFSPDGRLFAWGDTRGGIHLWGVPAP